MQELKTLGQFNTGIIWVVGVALIMLSLVGLVTGTVQDRAEDVVDDECSTIDTLSENLVTDAGSYISDNFPLLGLVVTVAIIGAIIMIFRSVM